MSSNSAVTSSLEEKIRGFPKKCLCGRDVADYTSKSFDNPGRPYYRCKSRRDDHLFKWVEEAVLEELEDALPRLGRIENEVWDMKREKEDTKMELKELKELKEETIKMKMELKRAEMISTTVFVLLSAIAVAIWFRH